MSGLERTVFVAFEDGVPVDACVPLNGFACWSVGTGAAGLRFSAQNRLDVANTAGHQLKVVARCEVAAPPCWAGAPQPHEAFVYRTEVALHDVAFPRLITAPRGALLASSSRGTASVSFDAADAGGGSPRRSSRPMAAWFASRA